MSLIKPKWEVAWDQKQSRYYYFDRASGESTWVKPPGCTVQAPKGKPAHSDASPHKPTLLPEGWEAVFDEKEKKYFYFHSESRQRSWFKPSSAMASRVAAKSAVTRASEPKEEDEAAKLAKSKTVESSATVTSKVAPTKREKNDLVSIMWDAKAFLHRLQDFKSDGGSNVALRCALAEIKGSNDDHMRFRNLHVPETMFVPYSECIQALKNQAVQAYRLDPAVSISRRDTASAINFFAQDQRRVVCALNFCDGRIEKVGGEYATPYMRKDPSVFLLEDNDNQEEDMCRRLGVLYASLEMAKKQELYPFGPSTCDDVTKPHKYRDVLFTPYAERDFETERERKGLHLTRGPREDGYPILPEDKFRRCCVVHAAPPCILEQASRRPDKFDNKLLFEAVTSIFVAPVLKEPRCTTLILGAWGCGSRHGIPAKKIAPLFAQAIIRTLPEIDICLGKLYHEVHFAIPDAKSEGCNYSVFQKALANHGIHLDEL